jgi:uncharacterized protein (DUF1330 family)
MSACVLVDLKVHDPEGYKVYVQAATATVSQYGGRYLARGGRTEVLEGDAHPARTVILESESIEQAKAWLHSPECAPARSLRHKTAETRMIVVEGVG